LRRANKDLLNERSYRVQNVLAAIEDQQHVPRPQGFQNDGVQIVGSHLKPDGNGNGRGDLVIHVTVETPSKLDVEQEKVLRELAKLRGEEAPPGKFMPGQQGFFSRLRDAFNGR